MINERGSAEREQTPEARVEALARQLAETINAGTVDGRERLRELAVGLLRDEVEVTEPLRSAAPQPEGRGGFNPFAIGIPFILMGSLLVFLFPPVGLLMFAAAALMLGWGVATTLLRRR